MDPLTVNHRLRVSQNKILHVHRRFQSGKGHISVKKGQVVSPEDMLGVGDLVSGFKTLNVSHILGISPTQATLLLQKKVGDRVYQNELIAKTSSFFGFRKKFLVAESDGMVSGYNPTTGDLLIKLLPKKESLVSGVFGIVDNVDEANGVVTLRTQATVIYGLIGSGKERVGLVKSLGSADMLVSSKQVGGASGGQILVGGASVFLDTLRKGVNNHVAGFLCGGMDATDFKSIYGGNLNLTADKFIDVGVTLVLTEGFGTLNMGDDIFSLVAGFEGKFAVIDGRRSRMILPSQDNSSLSAIKSTSIPIESMDDLPKLAEVPLKVGLKVRILSTNQLAQQGVVIAIDQSTTYLPSGLQSYMVTVETKFAKMKIPYQNLEVI
jgi:hypothetical protein